MRHSRAIATLSVVGASVMFPLCGAIAQSPELPDGPGKDIVAQSCTVCHGPEMITAQRRSSAEWADVVNRMIGNGASLTDEQSKEVVAYLGTYLGKPSGSTDAASKTPSSDRRPMLK